MIEKKHWEKFYADKKAPTEPTKFAKWVGKCFDGFTILDVGSGNGRDSLHLAKKNIVISLDPTGEPYKKHKNLAHIKKDIEWLLDSNIRFRGVVYSRFLVHAIPKEITKALIDFAPDYFVAEFRVKGDEPVIYKDHKRVYWTPEEFLKLFDKKDWKFVAHQVGRDLANYKNENPLVMRVIARRKRV